MAERTDISEIKNNKSINKSKSWFFKESDKIDKHLAKLIKNIRKWQMNIGMTKWDITTDITDITYNILYVQILHIRRYYAWVYANTFEKWEGIKKKECG